MKLFVGHNHNNDFGGYYGVTEMTYCRKTGFGSFGPYNGTLRGGRLIMAQEIFDDSGKSHVDISHKIVANDGSIIENQVSQVRGDYKISSCVYSLESDDA